MIRKSVLGLLLFAGLIISALFYGAEFFIRQANVNQDMELGGSHETDLAVKDVPGEQKEPEHFVDSSEAEEQEEGDNKDFVSGDNPLQAPDNGSSIVIIDDMSISHVTEEPWLSSNPSDTGFLADELAQTQGDTSSSEDIGTFTEDGLSAKDQLDQVDTLAEFKKPIEKTETSADTLAGLQLIIDSSTVDYYAYIPETEYDQDMEIALDIENPNIGIDAEAAILFDATTKTPLFHKNPIMVEFPASTSKLLTAIVALENSTLEEVVTVGDEITMIAYDSTTAGIRQGQKLTMATLLEGMLLPSGNDAAYTIAVHIGRKALGNSTAPKEVAVDMFVRIMNDKAKQLGVKNSCFKTPDGYDAIGQYTTAYDMGLIGMAAIEYDTITEICQKSRSRNIFVSGEDVTWESTNKLITRYSGQYYSCAIGLKTGTSTMAGRCLVAAASRDGKEVVCVIMDSSSSGRWEDAITLLEYGLSK